MKDEMKVFRTEMKVKFFSCVTLIIGLRVHLSVKKFIQTIFAVIVADLIYLEDEYLARLKKEFVERANGISVLDMGCGKGNQQISFNKFLNIEIVGRRRSKEVEYWSSQTRYFRRLKII